ncbi:MAG: cupin domain-containing protein [Polyangiaceae bacterium]|nr:cupin domain-containing protein [Polyangiaceae bacterium]
MRPFLAFSAALVAASCSRTAPETQWPPPGPAGGLPYVPLPDSDDRQEPAPVATPPAPVVPKAIDGSLPAAPPASLARAHACRDAACKLEGFVPDPSFGKSVPSGADSPGVIWLEEIAAGSAVIVPRHHQLELFAVAISGTALASGDDGGAVKLERWSALRAPGLGVAIKAGDGGVKLVVGLAAKTGTVQSAIDRAKERPFEVRWKKRPAPLTHVALSGAPDLAWAGGVFHARIGFGSETPIPGSWGVLLAAPGAEIKEHDHPTWEHVAVLDGAGSMRVDGQAHPVKPGSVFDLAPGVKHSLTLSGDRGLVVVQMYTPSGPEQRFVELSQAEAAKK